MKCPLCVDGVLGLAGSEVVYCGNCDGEGILLSLPYAKPYVEEAIDTEGAGGHGVKCEVHAEAL